MIEVEILFSFFGVCFHEMFQKNGFDMWSDLSVMVDGGARAKASESIRSPHRVIGCATRM